MRLMRAAWLCLACAFAAMPAASSTLPSGWRLEGDALVWTSTAPLRMGGARYEFRSGDRLLGYPFQDGNRLRLAPAPAEGLDELSVWAGGRRIDLPLAATRVAVAPPPAEPALEIAAADPAAPGQFATRRLRYALPDLAIPELPVPVEVLAEVTTPVGEAGLMPLVLLLHGRHSTCYRGGPGGELSGEWPCPPGWRAVPSHTGYRYIADVLASQGNLVISISANGINGQDGLFPDGGASARSQLVRHHLAQWSEWSRHGGDPWNGRFRNRVDLDAVVLVGHSRGGEGVERAAIDSWPEDPWRVRGLALIGPTAFGRQVAHGIHTAVILPFCDGDVSDLQGQQYVDAGRDRAREHVLRSSVVALGTNHNYYNTEWTPGLAKAPAWDDWFDAGDPQCGEDSRRRLMPAEQQAVGLAYTAALVDLALRGGRRSVHLLDGTRIKPRSIGRAQAIVHALGGSKQLLYAAGRGEPPQSLGLTTRVCRGYFTAGPFDLRPGCAPQHYFELTPHWSPMAFAETAPAPRALRVDWRQSGGWLRIPVNAGTLTGDALDFRIAGDPGAPPVELDLRVRGAGGRWVAAGRRPLVVRSYHGPSPLGKVLARQLRADLRATGIDLREVTAIEIRPRSSRGRFWLLDISARRDRLIDVADDRLPTVSVGDLRVPEGDAGEFTVEIPILVDGPVAKRARLWVQFTDYTDFVQPTRGTSLVLEPGTVAASVPFTFVADDVYNPYPRVVQVTLLAQRNAVTADFDGQVEIEDDEPAPALTVDSAEVTAGEGGFLTWTFRLSAPLADSVFWSIQFQPAAGRFRELDTDDVPAWFLEQYGIVPPVPAVPLSGLGLFLGIEFPPGATEATVTIPTAADALAEPLEGVVLLLDGFGDPVVPVPIEITGTIPGA